MKKWTIAIVFLWVLLSGYQATAQSRAVVYLVPNDGAVESLSQEAVKQVSNHLSIAMIMEPTYEFLKAEIHNEKNHQYDASSILVDLQNRFSNRYIPKQSIIIGLTSQDLYSSDFDWRFVYGLYQIGKNSQSAVLSTARLEQSFYDEMDDAAIRNDRLAKMLMRYSCVQLLQKELVDDGESVLRSSIMSIYDLDGITKDCDGKTFWKKGPFATMRENSPAKK